MLCPGCNLPGVGEPGFEHARGCSLAPIDRLLSERDDLRAKLARAEQELADLRAKLAAAEEANERTSKLLLKTTGSLREALSDRNRAIEAKEKAERERDEAKALLRIALSGRDIHVDRKWLRRTSDLLGEE